MTIQTERDQKRRLDAARKIAPLLDREARAGAEQGCLTPAVVDALRNGGFVNFGVAKELGGEQASYVDWASVIEELSRADGSAGWSMMATTSHAASFSSVLPDAGIERFYADGPPSIAGMPAPRGRAERVDGGYNFTGKHQFASGSMIADHFVGGAIVFEDGEMVMADNGLPEMIAAIVPKDQVRQMGNWEVNGLEATASIDYEIGPLFLPEDEVVHVNPWVSKVYRGTSFWALGVGILGPLGHCGPVLGVSRRALQEIAELAPRRQRKDGPYAAVGDQPQFQHDFTYHEAAWRAARLLFHDLLRELDEWTLNNDEPAPEEYVARTKQVTRYVHDVAVGCVDFAYEYSGSSGLRKDGVIGRCFRDVHAMNQHIVIDRHNYIDAAPLIMEQLAAELQTIKRTS